VFLAVEDDDAAGLEEGRKHCIVDVVLAIEIAEANRLDRAMGKIPGTWHRAATAGLGFAQRTDSSLTQHEARPALGLLATTASSEFGAPFSPSRPPTLNSCPH